MCECVSTTCDPVSTEAREGVKCPEPKVIKDFKLPMVQCECKDLGLLEE